MTQTDNAIRSRRIGHRASGGCMLARPRAPALRAAYDVPGGRRHEDERTARAGDGMWEASTCFWRRSSRRAREIFSSSTMMAGSTNPVSAISWCARQRTLVSAEFVIWGLHRDSLEVSEIALPLFSLGVTSAGPQRLDPRPADVFDAAQVGPHLVTSKRLRRCRRRRGRVSAAATRSRHHRGRGSHSRRRARPGTGNGEWSQPARSTALPGVSGAATQQSPAQLSTASPGDRGRHRGVGRQAVRGTATANLLLRGIRQRACA